jgi:NADH:ubiquinone oxidoreductase subunit E
MPLETEATAEIRALVADLRPDDADLLEGLHRVQHRYGYVSAEAMEVIGQQLRLAPAHVYGTVTYYADFRTEPPAPVVVGWCSGPACRLRNGAGIRDAMLAVLGTELGERTDDGRIEVDVQQCDGSCERAPQIWIDGRVVGNLNAAEGVRIARRLQAGEEPAQVGDPGVGSRGGSTRGGSRGAAGG